MMKRMARRGARLGQHFLTGVWAARRLAEAVAVRPGETVLEIGPGKGALTKELLATGARVVAVEKDEALGARLRDTFDDAVRSGQLELIEQDIRDFDPAAHHVLRSTNYVLAANIPYYITGEIIRRFLTAKNQPRAMALLVQKEVADRIMSRDGKESILSLSVRAYGTPKVVAKVSRGNFSPPPSVDSAILVVSDISKKFFDAMDEKLFFKVVRAGFASKRKKLSSNLAAWGRGRVSEIFDSLGLSENARAEDIPVGQWKEMVLRLAEKA
jgi:16S rRNA (adenine1518-N6/adenine1519-N6)-dimethyltransferase